jgi:hypothetical protein
MPLKTNPSMYVVKSNRKKGEFAGVNSQTFDGNIDISF